MPSTSTTSLKLDSEIKDRVQRLAEARRRSAHWIMREAIAEYVAREEKREQFRLDTLAAWEEDERTGLHLTEQEADEWLTKLVEGKNVPVPECHVSVGLRERCGICIDCMIFWPQRVRKWLDAPSSLYGTAYGCLRNTQRLGAPLMVCCQNFGNW